MSNPLEHLLQTRDFILADGATGTSLFNMGLQSGDAPELWNENHPDRVAALYQGAVEAGSDLFLTNSFGGTQARLKLHNAQDRAYALNKRAAEIAREVADNVNHNVIVAGAMGPTGEIMAPIGSLTHAHAVEMFHEQAQGLKDGGADVLWIETMSAPQEYAAAAEAAARTGLPWCGTMSFDTAGHTMMGLTPAGMIDMVETLPVKPLAYGANCGVGAADLVRTVLGFRADGNTRPIIAKGNAGIPKYVDGCIHYDGTPELMAHYAVFVRDAGAKIIGGCCGTTPDHLRHMRRALEQTPRGPVPSLDLIAETLGPFSSASDDTPNAGSRRDRRGRRRSARTTP